MSKRSIRLKEHEANLNITKEIAARTQEVADESLPPGPYLLRTDDHGFILTGNDVDADAPDLIVVGDSFVESIVVSEPLRFASQVERVLAAGGSPRRVLNGGYSGMTSLHMLGILTVKLPPLMKRDTKLLLVVGQSDANALSAPGLYWEQTKTVTPFGHPTDDSPVLAEPWKESFTRMLTTVVSFAKLQGYDIALAAGGFRNGDFNVDGVLRRTFRRNREHFDKMIEIRRFIVGAVRSIAADSNVPLFDLSDQLDRHPEYFYDALHLNLAGHAMYAKALATWIAEDWVAPAR